MTTADMSPYYGYGMTYPTAEDAVIYGWAEPPKTLVTALEDEIHRLCLAREIEPIKLDERDRERLRGLLEVWK